MFFQICWPFVPTWLETQERGVVYTIPPPEVILQDIMAMDLVLRRECSWHTFLFRSFFGKFLCLRLAFSKKGATNLARKQYPKQGHCDDRQRTPPPYLWFTLDWFLSFLLFLEWPPPRICLFGWSGSRSTSMPFRYRSSRSPIDITPDCLPTPNRKFRFTLSPAGILH